ncbi:hypothetical protein FGIG_08560 [Fasciola gigantica]|uniref:Uncharacterized protein n=1 Tax=Fasciola gigantica TaxID=46835 RepID=A0A504Y6E6_FASGI|nr:hypothetical protein FGIG_08560 [Fasciola gigantica]
MLIEIQKRWPGQKKLHLNPHFSMNPVCYQILFAIESLNNSMNSIVLGCRSQLTLNNESLALIYLAVSPTKRNFDSGHETMATEERGNLLIELEKVLTKHFEISSHHIRIQHFLLTGYALQITLLLRKMDLRYPLIRASMRTEKGTSSLYAEVDLWYDVTEIDEQRQEAIISLSNEISEASNRKAKLGSFEEGSKI